MRIVYARTLALVTSLALLTAACETVGPESKAGPKTVVGGLGGAAAGGLLGAALGGRATGIAAGTLIGGLLGGALGSQLDDADRRVAAETAQRALETAPSDTPVTWRNPDSGRSGTITPTRTYQTADGRYCREFQQEVTIGGEQHQAFGTACRRPDGSWQVLG
ncbi:MAG TPA: RT0821/Lpp0805 family surface protein [Thermodesulfobacteriota bacterium]